MGLPEAGSPLVPPAPSDSPGSASRWDPQNRGERARDPQWGAGEAEERGRPGRPGGGHCSREGGRPSPQPPSKGHRAPTRAWWQGWVATAGCVLRVGCATGGLSLSEVQPPPPLLAEGPAFPPLRLRPGHPGHRSRPHRGWPPPAQLAGRPGDSEAAGAGPP